MVKLLRILVFIYLLAMAIAYFFGNRFIFLPPPTSYQDSSEFIKIPVQGGDYIYATYLKNPDAKYTLLVSHGNAEDLGQIKPFLNKLKSQGFSVFAYDYQGYGLSNGKPSEENAYIDEATAYQYLTTNLYVSPDRIITYGRSLGAALAFYIAENHIIAGVIAESPFVSALRVITKYKLFPFDYFDNLKRIKNVSEPTLFIHGTNDNIIPIWHSKELFAAANSPKYHEWILGATHNSNPWKENNNSYWTAIENFAKTLG